MEGSTKEVAETIPGGTVRLEVTTKETAMAILSWNACLQGTTKEALNSLHQPIFYLIGGPADVAYPNAQKDFDRIENVPVVMMNTLDGHSGTYYEKNGGSYAVAVLKWLNWQFKGNVGEAAFFLDDEFLKYKYPDWKVVRKNF